MSVDDLSAFLAWGFGDLRSNTTRGVLAEFLVGRLVGADLTVPREEWAPWDVRAADGTTIEVKSTALVQAWAPGRAAPRPSFGGLLARTWLPEIGYSAAPEVRAEVYVFAVNTAQQLSDYQPLDLGQWAFRVVPGPTVRDWGQKSIALSRLRGLGYPAVPASALAAKVAEARSKTPAAEGR